MTLNLLQAGEVATTASVNDGEEIEIKARINGLELRTGQEVAVTRCAYMGDPVFSKPEMSL